MSPRQLSPSKAAKYTLPLIALCGFVFALYVVRADNRAVPVAQPVSEPAGAPFSSFVSGSGLIESESENVEIGSSVAGVVKKVFVKAGDRVTMGAPLFELGCGPGQWRRKWSYSNRYWRARKPAC